MDLDKKDRLSAVVVESLTGENCRTGDLAATAFYSRTQFHRVFRALIDETPAAMRRRLLTERAAWELTRTGRSVTDIALDAGYGSLEAFSRAFHRAFGVSPSLFRRMGANCWHLPSTNGIHFRAPGSRREGAYDMDLFDRFAGADSWHITQLLAKAKELTDEQLDRPLTAMVQLLPWEERDRNLRQSLTRLVYAKELWTAALTGGQVELQEPDRLSVAELQARHDKVDAELMAALKRVREKGTWDETFVDALCEPPETFTIGGMVAHLVTFNTYRRLNALATMRCLGVSGLGMGCPMEYEEALAPWPKS
jgi:AraC family transcriptional regulator